MAENKFQKRIYQIDNNTFCDISQIIGVEINKRKRSSRTFFEVILGFTIGEHEEGEGFNTSMKGVVPNIEFQSFEEVIDYLRDIGIEVEYDPQLMENRRYLETVKDDRDFVIKKDTKKSGFHKD